MSGHLGIFAKFWQPGLVKTRLAKTIGNQPAAAVYREFLRTLLVRFASVGDSRELVISPVDRQTEFRSLAPPAWHLVDQGSGDLGQRMARFFERGFSLGKSRIVLVGSDSPTLPVAVVRQAFSALDEHRVVLGPSEDGGYYLVGARGVLPPIFTDIDWSTDKVWLQTTAQLRRRRIRYEELATWYDVDSGADLWRLHADLKQLARDDSIWNKLLAEVEGALDR